MSDLDPNLLKLDMQITAKRLRLRDKATNILQPESTLQNTFTKLKLVEHEVSNTAARRKPFKENKTSTKASHPRRRNVFIRRPVDYKWNRGGRLKEIRIRTQARKFLFLWIEKTFGKVTYSQAQRFYLKNIKLKYFKSWKDLWWENCGEMKMFIRAEYFSRYQIYAKVWIVWRKYVASKRHKKELTSKASSHHSTVTYKKFINLWKTYVQIRKTKKSLYSHAYSIADSTSTKRCWVLWCQALKQKRKAASNYQFATIHWNDLTLKKTWTFWRNRHKEEIRINHLKQIACEKLAISRTKKHFSYWRDYVYCRRRKYALYDKARDLYNLSLKHKTICMWWTRYEALLDYRQRMYTCQVLSVRSTKRRYFLAWTEFVNLQNQKHRQQAIAQIHYRKSLKKLSLKCLKMSVSLKQKKIRMLYAAQRFYASTKLRNSWVQWQSRIEKIEEIDLVELSVLAKEHYRNKLLRRMFASVVTFRQQRKDRKSNIVKAETHFVVKALPRCFSKWRTFVEEVKDVNQMRKDADTFHRELISTKYFYAWYSAFEEAQEDRTRERMAVMQYSENCSRHHFQLWLHRTRTILSSNHNDAVARVHYRRALLQTAVRAWICYTKDSIQRQRKLEFAESYHHDSLRAGAWLEWKKYIVQSRLKKSKHGKAVAHNEVHILQKSLKSWQMCWKKGKECERQAEQRYEAKRLALLKASFVEWRNNSAALVEEREAERIAYVHWLNHLQSIAFKQWKQWTVVRRFKLEQAEETLRRAVSSLNIFKLQRCFHKWKESKDAKKLQNFSTAAASQHYYNRICKLVFQAWQLHNYILLKKKLMQRQAAVFRKSKLLCNSVETWKTALQWRYDETAKSCDALWHWAITLEGRCFDSWRSYLADRKRKKKRYDQAMDARRSHMIKDGCIKMLQYHADSLARRTQLEACQQAKTRYTGYHIAWKYGKRWIDKVRAKMGERKQTSFPTNVTTPFSYTFLSTQRHSATSSLKSWISRPLPIVIERLPAVAQSNETYMDRCVAEKQRPAPRLPDFLDESLRREDIFDDYLTAEQSKTPLVPEHIDEFFVERHNQAFASNFAQVSQPSTSNVVPIQSTENSNDKLYSKVHEQNFQKTDAHYHQNTTFSPPCSTNPEPSTNSRSVVLLPPSAFRVGPQSRDPPSPSLSQRSSEMEQSSSSTLSDTECCEKTFRDSRKDTFKTFVASPSSTRDELKLIYNKLQDFQKLRDQLKVLKQQKEVLKSWIEENLATMSTSKSLDMASVQEEIKEIDHECCRISEELLVKRPEVENLAVRVRVLSARPT